MRKTVWRCLDHLTRLDLAALRIFAEHRLARVGLDPNLGADIVQDALCAVLRGLKQLRSRGHDVIVFHVLDHDELTFPFDRPTLFLDMEEEIKEDEYSHGF